MVHRQRGLIDLSWFREINEKSVKNIVEDFVTRSSVAAKQNANPDRRRMVSSKMHTFSADSSGQTRRYSSSVTHLVLRRFHNRPFHSGPNHYNYEMRENCTPFPILISVVGLPYSKKINCHRWIRCVGGGCTNQFWLYERLEVKDIKFDRRVFQVYYFESFIINE